MGLGWSTPKNNEEYYEETTNLQVQVFKRVRPESLTIESEAPPSKKIKLITTEIESDKKQSDEDNSVEKVVVNNETEDIAGEDNSSKEKQSVVEDIFQTDDVFDDLESEENQIDLVIDTPSLQTTEDHGLEISIE